MGRGSQPLYFNYHSGMSWVSHASKNLLPLSEESQRFELALKEWEYRGNTYDLEVPSETCQLCDHPDIRFQFEIVNKSNDNSLLVGSECIKRFDGIAVLDADGNALSTDEAKQKVDRDRRKLVTDAQVKSLLNSLVELSRKDEDFDIESFIADYQERGAFTPRQLALLFWRLKKYEVPFKKVYFKIYIRKAKDKEALLALKDFQLRDIWPALSPTQQQFVRDSKKKG